MLLLEDSPLARFFHIIQYEAFKLDHSNAIAMPKHIRSIIHEDSSSHSRFLPICLCFPALQPSWH